MNKHLKISIITPSYNQGEYIEKTILSILDQNYPNLEYIIMDGGSTDNTVDIIKKYEDRITFWQSEKDKGQTGAINKGFEKCTGDIVTWLCSDDYYEPNILFEVEKAFKENTDINLVCGNRRTFGDGINDTLYPGWSAYEDIEETMIYGDYDQPPSFFRKEVWDEIFPLSENLRVYMDCEMWLRYLLFFGQDKALHIPKLFANGLFHATSKSVNEAVPCRKTLNTLYFSIAETLRLNKRFLDDFEKLERHDYYGKWDIKTPINNEKLTTYLSKKFGPQFKDPSHIYRDVAEYFMYLGSAKAGMKNALDAIKVNPFKLINYRTFFYCWRKTF
jgi:glycosyltransferase involved in cell wall biosynthesis